MIIRMLYLLVVSLMALTLSYLTRIKVYKDPRPIDCFIIHPKTLALITEDIIKVNNINMYKGIQIITNNNIPPNEIMVMYKQDITPVYKYTPYNN